MREMLLCAVVCGWLAACGSDSKTDMPQDQADMNMGGDAGGDWAADGNIQPPDAGDMMTDTGTGGDDGVAADTGAGPVDTTADQGEEEPGLVVLTVAGPVRGVIEGGSREFRGIPYVAPPVGDLRWRTPQPHTGWSEPLDATAFGPACPQLPSIFGFPLTGEEDCLTLSVWTPWPLPDSPAPVMVFLHGGGFLMGTAAMPVYIGRPLASRTGTVVVTLNYRLGALGFLAHPALSAEDPAHLGSGNWGIEDQRAALQWVRDNISAFGGAPDNVTLFGESAGAISVCTHLASPRSAGLFQRAILESGGCSNQNPDLATAEQQGVQLAEKLGCAAADDVVACLRGKDAMAVLEALPPNDGFFFGEGAEWGPVVDGFNLAAQPHQLLKQGSFNQVPVVLGSNGDEGTLFVYLSFETELSDEQYDQIVTSLFGPIALQVLEQYPVAEFGSTRAALSALLGDVAFVCPMRMTARAVSEAGSDCYLYRFAHAPDNIWGLPLGSYHSSELPFVFDVPLIIGGSFTPEEQQLAHLMGDYWTQFARSGDPNGEASPVAWPRYTTSSDEHLILDLESGTDAGLHRARCDFWEPLLSY